jgi:hypothetical protein
MQAAYKTFHKQSAVVCSYELHQALTTTSHKNIPELYQPSGHFPDVTTERLLLLAYTVVTQAKPGRCTHARLSKYVTTGEAGKAPSLYTAWYCDKLASQSTWLSTPSQLVTAKRVKTRAEYHNSVADT